MIDSGLKIANMGSIRLRLSWRKIKASKAAKAVPKTVGKVLMMMKTAKLAWAGALVNSGGRVVLILAATELGLWSTEYMGRL